ncbi:hypothetical protein JTB14_003822 [Gonioctena quinquepunctata]|nr:hypothetical protein JTB14_003822 [Gonioctena quinquepunctata]
MDNQAGLRILNFTKSRSKDIQKCAGALKEASNALVDSGTDSGNQLLVHGRSQTALLRFGIQWLRHDVSRTPMNQEYKHRRENGEVLRPIDGVHIGHCSLKNNLL